MTAHRAAPFGADPRATCWRWPRLASVPGLPTIGRAAAPKGQLTWGVHISLAPTWFDPAETPGHHHARSW